jgi:SAM-dependent methyltransferase
MPTVALIFLLPFLVQEPGQIPINTPYVGTPPNVVNSMLKLARVHPGDVVYDLGCGDGRIVIAAAKDFGANGVGVDINAERISEARANARAAGVQDRVAFEVQDLFATDLHTATVVALYLLPEANLRLRERLQKELRPGTRVVANSFNMGDWQPDAVENVDGNPVYMWVIRPR